MFGTEIAIGPGKADLLAWLLVDTMNRCFREPVVAAATGGSGGGGAQVTAFGRKVLATFRKLETTVERALDAPLAEFTELLSDRP